MKRSNNGTKLLLVCLYNIGFLLCLVVVSGELFIISKALVVVVFIIDIAMLLLGFRIALGFVLEGPNYTYVPLLKVRLRRCNKKWVEAVDYIKETGDYGMCCSELTAVQCAKEYCFGKLVSYADHYGYTIVINGEDV